MVLGDCRRTLSEFTCGRRARAILGLVVCLGWSLKTAGQASAQEAAQAPPADLFFGEEIDVRVVNLEVVVEDRSGNRVHGLEADDFRLLVNGVEVAVDYFTEILENRAVESRDGGAPPAIGDGDSVPTNYLLFVDDDHTHVTFRRPVVRGFARELANLGLRDQVAVVVQSRRRLQVLSPFTTDRRRTRDALEKLERGRPFGGVLTSPRLIDQARFADNLTAGRPPVARVAEDLTSVAADLPFAAMDLPSAAREARAESLARDLEFSVTAVSSTMRSLDAPVGRKVLLLVAGDWPIGSFRLAGQGIGLRSDWNILDALVDTANVLGYTVYPVDQQKRPSLMRWQNLRQVAEQTGGRAYVAGANLGALRRVSEDTSNYYWLGFVPEYRRDDRAHEVRVELRRPGLRLRSRTGYVDLSRRAEADMETQGRLLFPDQTRNREEPALRVEFGEPEPTGPFRRKMLVPVTVHIPVGYFPVFPFEGRFLARLELRFAVVDRNGQQARIPVIPVSLAGRTQPAPDAVVPYDAVLTLRRRSHDIIVSVHDPVSRQTVSTRTELRLRMDPTTTGGSP
ncbi:MAG: VWA domain-containing protein [Holophagales bacterium]|nr:VWA domain-containing protein [Holophagales bacterium]